MPLSGHDSALLCSASALRDAPRAAAKIAPARCSAILLRSSPVPSHGNDIWFPANRASAHRAAAFAAALRRMPDPLLSALRYIRSAVVTSIAVLPPGTPGIMSQYDMSCPAMPRCQKARSQVVACACGWGAAALLRTATLERSARCLSLAGLELLSEIHTEGRRDFAHMVHRCNLHAERVYVD